MQIPRFARDDNLKNNSFYAAGFVVLRFASANANPNMNIANSTNVKIDAVNENARGASGYISVRSASTP